MALQGDTLILSIKLSRPLGEAVGVSVSIFGYRFDRSFSEMPKLHIKLGAAGYEVYDEDKKLLPHIISVLREAKQITFFVPLKVLGNPHKLLTSGRTYIADVPMDWVSWRLIELTP